MQVAALKLDTCEMKHHESDLDWKEISIIEKTFTGSLFFIDFTFISWGDFQVITAVWVVQFGTNDKKNGGKVGWIVVIKLKDM